MQTRWRRQRGQAVVEAAMTLAVVFMVVFWIFELGWVMYTYSVLADAANEGVRYSIVHSGGDASGTRAVVKTFAGTSLHNVSAISTAVTFPDGNATPPNRVRVVVTYTYLPYISNYINPPTMHAYSEGRMVVQ
jgi:Flp pilus assembly protein TadG